MPRAKRPKRFSTKRRDKKEAMQVAMEEQRKVLDREQLGVKPEMTLAEAWDRYAVSMEGRSSQTDIMRVGKKLLGQGKWAGKVFNLSADMKLSQLRTHHVAELRERRQKEGLAANSIRIEIRYLQRVYNLARKSWGVAVAPDVDFEVPKTKAKTRYLSVAEEAAVLARLDGKLRAYEDAIGYRRARSLFLFLIDTGLRVGEALDLRWSQIERENRLIRVYRSKTQSWSTVPLTTRAEQALEVFKDQERPFLHMDRAIKVLRKALNEVCNIDEFVIRSAGRATIHSLRDTYASRLVQRGLSLFKVSKLLGHTTVAMTAKYANLEIDSVADEALSLLENQ